MTVSAAETELALRGSRILIVGRDYYFYTREIAAELRDTFGASASFYPIEPAALLYRLLKKSGAPSNWWLRRHHRRIIATARRHPPDIVIFVQVHQIGDLMKDYRDAFGAARFVLYYWDSLKTHDYRAYARYFDKVFTFDRADAIRVPGFEYLPLFYTERFRRLRQQQDMAYDMSFVGVAVSPRRYERLKLLRIRARRDGISLFDYVVVSPILYLKMLIRGKVLRQVHFRSLGEHALLRIYAGSRSILDLPNNVQSGYTMRTFESLGAHRKLVTTKQEIVNEDFYTTDSVCVIDDQGELPGRSFLDSQATFSPAVDTYFLRTWILRLLGPVITRNDRSIEAVKPPIGCNE